MRPFKLFLYSMSESYLKVILLLVTSAVVAVYGLYAISLISEYYGIINDTRKAGLNDKVIVYTDMTDSYYRDRDYRSILTELNNLSYMDEIETVVPFNDVRSSFTVNDNHRANIVDISYLGECDYHFELIEGRSPDTSSVNEAVVSEVGSDLIKVGDELTIPFYGYVYNNEDNTYYWIPDSQYSEENKIEVTVKIVGIVADDTPLVSCNHKSGESKLTDLFEPLSAQPGINVIAWDLRTDGGARIRTTSFAGVLITPADGFDQLQVANALVNDGMYTESQISTYDEMMANYQNENGELRAMAIRNSLLAILLSITVVFCSVNMSLKKKQKELITYYMCGSSWGSCIIGEVLIYLPSLVVGTLLGFSLLQRYSERLEIFVDSRFLTMRYMMLMMGINLATVALLIVPTVIVNSRRHPIELMRKD